MEIISKSYLLLLSAEEILLSDKDKKQQTLKEFIKSGVVIG
ncbi:MAG: hypothetical protein ACRCYA_10355 [Cetobacterium sp.]